MDRSVFEVHCLQYELRSRLVVSTGVSFASKWLTPRLHRLMARYLEYVVHLEVTDNQVDFMMCWIVSSAQKSMKRYGDESQSLFLFK